MGFTRNVIYIGHQGCLGCDYLGNSGLASCVGMTVVVCEHQGKVTCVARNPFMVAAAHEYPVIGNEAVVKYGKAFYIADVCKGCFLSLIHI